MKKIISITKYDKTLPETSKGNECKCPKCGNSFYISGRKCYSCGYE